MDDKAFENLRARTDAKLRYAEVHLKELKNLGRLGGDEFDRAHQESFLFHFLGAKEAFLIELNAYYGCGLPENELSAGKLRAALSEQGKVSPELRELFTLENQDNCWLNQAKNMRDHSTHVSGVSRAFHVGGSTDGEVWLRNPRTGEPIQRHFIAEFDDWILNMKALLERLRSSAIKSNAL